MLTFSSVNYSKLTDFETTTEEVTTGYSTTEEIGTTLGEVGTTDSITITTTTTTTTTSTTTTITTTTTEITLQFARVPAISDAECKQYYTGK